MGKIYDMGGWCFRSSCRLIGLKLFLLVVERVLKGKQSIVRNGVKHGINSLFVIETIKKKQILKLV